MGDVMTKPEPDYKREPIYWLVTWLKARERRDAVKAGEAERSLDRLGIRIAAKPCASLAAGSRDRAQMEE